MKVPHGTIRQSQLITTYGPGAMVDLPRHSVVVGGLDDWNFGDQRRTIAEDRLVQKIEELLQVQGLQLVVPDIAAGRLAAMFEAAGWHVITIKYGRRLTELYGRDGGPALRQRIDAMTNEEYQRILRASASELRERLPAGRQPRSRDVERHA